MNIYLDGQPLTLEPGTRYLDAVRALYPDDPRRALAVRVGGRTLPLTAAAQDGHAAATLTLASDEGRRIYERSLRFILLLAMRTLYPGARVRVANSTQVGVFVNVTGALMNAGAAQRIEREMRKIIDQDLPYQKTVITRAQAIDYFREEGEMDKVRLLTYRPYEHFQLYRLHDMLEYFYGEMAPSTGYTKVFSVQFHLPGLELRLPDPNDLSVPAPFQASPKLMKTFAETARWARILNCENVADLNEMIERRALHEFVRVNEALHEKSVSDIADAFVRSGAQLILIAGPSASGKTTFANRLNVQLRVRGLRPMKLSLDDYYIDRAALPLEENGMPDLERLDALDVELLGEHLVALLQGEPVDAPVFDFTRAARSEKTHRLMLSSGQPVIMEGIHALNDQLTAQVPRDRKFLIYVSALTTLNLDDHNRIRTTDVRLLRRMVRDHQFRGASPEATMDMWNSVRRGEHNYIFPFQECADMMFNSTLVYELAVLKKYAYPRLCEIDPDSPHYTRAHRLVKFLNYIQSADVENEIPPNSILREFIGSSCFYTEQA